MIGLWVSTIACSLALPAVALAGQLNATVTQNQHELQVALTYINRNSTTIVVDKYTASFVTSNCEADVYIEPFTSGNGLGAVMKHCVSDVNRTYTSSYWDTHALLKSSNYTEIWWGNQSIYDHYRRFTNAP